MDCFSQDKPEQKWLVDKLKELDLDLAQFLYVQVGMLQ